MFYAYQKKTFDYKTVHTENLGVNCCLLEIVYLKFCHYLHTLMSFQTMIFRCDFFLLEYKNIYIFKRIFMQLFCIHINCLDVAFIYFFIYLNCYCMEKSFYKLYCVFQWKISYRFVNNDRDFTIQWTIPLHSLWGPNVFMLFKRI